MKTILYEIPASFFPGYRVTKPFHAKVNYMFVDDKVAILDAAFSDICLEYMNSKGLAERMKRDIAEAERKRSINLTHPIIASAITSFAPHI